MEKAFKTFVAILFFTCLLPLNASATVVKPLDLTQLTNQADLIFRGKVLAIESRWDEQRSKIWTFVTFSVDEVIKGSYEEKEITLKLPGGAIEAEDIRLRVDGVPEFIVGEEVLLFCSNDPKRINPIIGWHQGRFKIRFDEVHKQKVIEGERAPRLMPPKPPPGRAVAVPSKVTYGDFVDEVRRIMSQSPPSPKP
jgi:hypothetical protein